MVLTKISFWSKSSKEVNQKKIEIFSWWIIVILYRYYITLLPVLFCEILKAVYVGYIREKITFKKIFTKWSVTDLFTLYIRVLYCFNKKQILKILIHIQNEIISTNKNLHKNVKLNVSPEFLLGIGQPSPFDWRFLYTQKGEKIP